MSHLQATHQGNGYLYYKYIGDSTATPYEYLFEFVTFVKLEGSMVSPATNHSMFITSSCDTTRQITLNPISPPPNRHNPIHANAWQINTQYNCSDTAVQWVKYVYRNTRVLSPCADYRFSVSVPGMANYSNLISTSSLSLLFEADLNNANGYLQNTLPKPNLRRFTGDFWNGETYFIGALNAQHMYDTILIELSPSFSGSVSGASTPIPFSAGHSVLNPIDGSVFQLHNSYSGNDIIRFEASVPGRFKAALKVTTWANDTVNLTWLKTGSYRIEYEVFIDGLRGNRTPPGPQVFLPQGKLSDTLSCHAQKIFLEPNMPLDRKSFSSDGTQFRVFSRGKGQLEPVLGAEIISDSAIVLDMAFPLSKNDSLEVSFKPANDGRVLLNRCRYPQQVVDTLVVAVVGCSGTVGLPQNESTQWQVYPNPAREFIILQGSGTEKVQNIEIWSLSGRRLAEVEAHSGNIALPSLPAGLYQLRLRYSDGVVEPGHAPTLHRRLQILR